MNQGHKVEHTSSTTTSRGQKLRSIRPIRAQLKQHLAALLLLTQRAERWQQAQAAAWLRATSAVLNQWQRARLATGILALGATLAAAPQAQAAQFGKVGPEFQVNTFTVNYQLFSSIASDTNGNYVITWEDEFHDGFGSGIFAQRYNATGTAQGTNFLVNTYTDAAQRVPAIAMAPAGDFVITWGSLHTNSESSYGIYAQRFNAAGTPQGNEIHVNTFTSGSQSSPAIAYSTNGFIITWQSNFQDGSSYGIYAQRYDYSGTPQGSEFRVNTFTTSDQTFPQIAMSQNGDFVISWESFAQDGDSLGVYAQRFNASGAPQGSEFQVNTYTSSQQRNTTVAMNAVGDFVIAWQNFLTNVNPNNNTLNIQAQRYNAAGTPQGTNFQVSTYLIGPSLKPAVTFNTDGDFTIAFETYFKDGDQEGIFAQRYTASGTPVGAEFQLNTYTTDNQFDVSLAPASNGGLVASWSSQLQDGSSWGIYGQRFQYLQVVTPTPKPLDLLLSQPGSKLARLSRLSLAKSSSPIPSLSGPAAGTLLPTNILSNAKRGLPVGSRVIASGDINADGTLDVIIQNKATLTAWLLSPTTNNTVLSSFTYTLPPGSTVLGLGPILGSKPDLLLKKGTKLSAARNIGGTSFAPIPTPLSGKLTGKLTGILTNAFITASGPKIKSAPHTPGGTNIAAATTLGKLPAGRTANVMLTLGSNAAPVLITTEKKKLTGAVPLSEVTPSVTPAPVLFLTNAATVKIIGPK